MGGSGKKLRENKREYTGTDFKLAKKVAPEEYNRRFKREVGFDGPLIPLSFK